MTEKLVPNRRLDAKVLKLFVGWCANELRVPKATTYTEVYKEAARRYGFDLFTRKQMATLSSTKISILSLATDEEMHCLAIIAATAGKRWLSSTRWRGITAAEKLYIESLVLPPEGI